MESPQLVGVHLGTASVHVDVYSTDGERLAGDEAPVAEQTTLAWERALHEAAPALPQTGIGSVASTSGTAVLVDKYGEPVFPPQMYFDSAPEQASKLRDLDLSGLSINQNIAFSPTSPLPKILKLRAEHPEKFQRVEWILSPTTWLLYRLRFDASTPWRDIETDWTNALKFGADVTTPLPTWFESLFETLDLPRSLFPAIRPPGSFIGVADGQLAERTGFEGIKLFQGLTDGNASVLANGGVKPGDFSITFGASSVVKYVSESVSPHPALYYHRHPIDGYLPGASFDTGNLLRWFFDRILNCTPERGLELARQVPSGHGYEMFLKGNRSPFFDADVAGSLLGLNYDNSLSTEEVHGRLARGLITGIILTEWTYISLVEEHFNTDIDRVLVINDGTPTLDGNYDWWNTLRASIWDRPVVEMEPRTTAGAVMAPALITSIYSDVETAAENLLRERDVIEPDPSVGADFNTQKETYFDRWRDIAEFYQRE
ncbi:FGGY family carbohydrate kinase [Haloferax prahovense]|uniref:FGGY family carbohydrate kinase n=1 Tax=Haloferax prahovense TaxID=381852 RepID=UPI0006784B85|nr:FGGY family carbohydrate kinase [Haloferax prahovense]